MSKKISWILRIAFTAILLFIIFFELAEVISERGFSGAMKRPSVVGLFLIFALVSYVTSWFNIKLTAKLLLIFGLVLAVFTFIVPSVPVNAKALKILLTGIFILLAAIVYWAIKRKK